MQQNSKKFLVYMHKLKLDGRVYIGQTCMSLKQRSGSNGHRYKNCTKFYNAIQKYGWNNFEHIILFENLSQEEANIIEEKLISLFDTRNPKIGYNLDSGGTNKIHLEETKQKISNSLKGRFTKEKNPMFGKISPNAKKVLCIETNEVFNSATEAGRKYNIDNSSISKVCRKQRQYAGIHPVTFQPLHWEYLFEK